MNYSRVEFIWFGHSRSQIVDKIKWVKYFMFVAVTMFPSFMIKSSFRSIRPIFAKYYVEFRQRTIYNELFIMFGLKYWSSWKHSSFYC